MRIWRRRLEAGLALLLLWPVPFAYADGFAVEGPAIAAPMVDWSGIYAGVQVGGGLADTGWNFPVDSYFTLPDGKRAFDSDLIGGIFGGHLTWNRQTGAIVVGAELGINLTSMDEERVGQFTPLFPNDQFTTEIEGYGTLAGKLGYARDNYLLYVTGGYALGRVQFRAVSGPPGAGVIGDVKDFLHGVTVGTGVDFNLAQDVIIGIKYDFIWLHGDTDSIATHGTPSTDPFVLHMEDVDIHAITARLSFKLN